ncbi:gibberellin A4 carboxyl methyltransferase [Ranunculus cassubicifolius]
MDVERVFHMKEGVGDKSYAQNSSLQRKAFDMVKHITLETILDLYLKTTPQSLGIADLGCSSGPNTLTVIKEIINAITCTSHKLLRPTPEFRVSLNDLPSNDFNTIFKSLPDLYQDLDKETSGIFPLIFISAVPGSFYGRLFPSNTLHFIHSSYSLHWLSKIPSQLYDEEGMSINKGKVYISEDSPPLVSRAYMSQFQEDMTVFLKSRSEELVSGGRMVLILLGRRDQSHTDRGNSFFWELLSRSLEIMVCQGEIDKEKLDSYNVHFYAPSKYEIEDEVQREGSFAIDRLEMFENGRKESNDVRNYGRTVTTTVRAIQESMISHHFGEEIVEKLFEIYGELVEEEIAKEDIRPTTFILVLRKLV